LTDNQLRALQNASEVHVQPSQAEGYGHVIGEGMSCGAVVVTTDAPPMNELVGMDRGVLVRVDRSEPMRRGVRNFVDPVDLERKLSAVFAMSPSERETLGRAARAWYEAQHQRFEEALCTLLVEARDAVR
jgi:glycosyltransferase involved in cell wall biosynthesis